MSLDQEQKQDTGVVKSGNMKRVIILITFLFISSFAFSQTNQYELQLKRETAYTQWKQEYPSQNCEASFYWLISRSNGVDAYGRYLFKIYVYSNSRYCNGTWASTYIDNIYLYVDGYLINPNAPYWIMFRETYQPPSLSWWSANPTPAVRFVWGNVTVN
jgi:hypothetical protein